MEHEFKIVISDYKKGLKIQFLGFITAISPILIFGLILMNFDLMLGSNIIIVIMTSLIVIGIILSIILAKNSFSKEVISLTETKLISEKYGEIKTQSIERFYSFFVPKGGIVYIIKMKNDHKWSVAPYSVFKNHADEEFQKFVDTMEGKYGIKLEKK